ncbi:hypothetical protein CYMTET_16008 [Cymbomonas tetramitiformis]|uniref:EGF-like domain-containing protein n=1 Tax=Cymbomonas tetramitiformis TaxID=36881 RepID=A0AAE0GD22_9CHLO|nr:hypothetical protein CYMTET_16008 [Cymbomonas tetramitiformis]
MRCAILRTPINSVCEGFEPYMCDPSASSENVCSWDYTKVGFCVEDWLDGCDAVLPYSNQFCLESNLATPYTEKWGQVFSPESRCIGDGSEEWTTTLWEESRQEYLTWTRQTTGAICILIRCETTGEGSDTTYRIIATVGGVDVECVTGEEVDLPDSSGFSTGRIGPCPGPEFCQTNLCSNSCSNQGVCGLHGECQCGPGFVGHICGDKACDSDDDCDGAECELSSGLCGGAPSPDPPISPPPLDDSVDDGSVSSSPPPLMPPAASSESNTSIGRSHIGGKNACDLLRRAFSVVLLCSSLAFLSD